MSESTSVIKVPIARVVTPKQGRSVDFSDLWKGAPTHQTHRGDSRWNGGFVGRPALADQLWPAIKLEARDWGHGALKSCLGGLRDFWRFLDGYEQRFGVVLSLADIDEVKGLLWLHPPDDGGWKAPNMGYYTSCRSILQHGLLPVSRTPSLGVMMKPEVVHGDKADIQ